ncbi:hypothetical protein D8674_021474 [Pyrus ussuriensis x Pyrus communis]|uniref:NAC domain-containing protein n=1 Tax=Pyrus ussuriensis x Pyrus communis TaxID=2448454 RepID=A0A5N5GH85_9ROSA|nr:hypothetical protein D8674_021474 [Pyrus ussuriensis x Pyrus communis]
MAEFRPPLGFRFDPTDQKIFILLNRIVVEKDPLMAGYDSHIHKCSLFGHNSEPSEIWERYGGDQVHGQQLFFFFSELKRSRKNISRKMGHACTWSESGSKEIEGHRNPSPIGRKRKFRFENKCKSEDHGRWLLEEYSLYDAAAHDCSDTKASKNRYDFDFVICKMRRKSGENKRKSSDDQNTNNVEEPQESCSTLIINTDHLVLPLPDESNKRKRMTDVAYDDDPALFFNEDMLITSPTDSISIEELLAPLDSESAIASSENLSPDQMVETQEDVPLPTVGYAWPGADDGGPLETYYIPSNYYPWEDHQPKDQNVNVINNVEESNDILFFDDNMLRSSHIPTFDAEDIFAALDFDHDQKDGNQEEQLPLPTAGSAQLAIPSNYFQNLLNQPFEDSTYNYCSDRFINELMGF